MPTKKRRDAGAIPIPDDWNSAWACLQVQWPDSTLWRAILRGWIDVMSYGWTWDAKTGNLAEAQAVGREIWLRNNPLLECAGDCPEPEVVYIPVPCGGGGEEEEEMGQVVTDVTKNEIGQIVVWFGPCCSKVLDFAQDGTPQLPDDPLNPGDDTLNYSACGKAYAVTEVLFDVVKECHDEIDNLPWQWVSHVEQGVGLDLNNLGVIITVNQCIIMEGVDYDFDTILSTSEKKWLLCRLVDLMTADGDAPDDGVFGAAMKLMMNHQGIDVFASNLWSCAFTALGQENFNNVAMLGATNVDYDCACDTSGEELPDTWPDYGWYHRFEFADYATRPAWLSDGGQGSWQANVGLVSAITGETRDVWPKVVIPTGGGTMRRVAFHLSVPAAGTNWDDNSLGTRSAELAGQSTFPIPSPYAADFTFWWDVTCEVVLASDTDPYCSIYGGASGLPEGKQFKCIGFAIAGEGTDPFA